MTPDFLAYVQASKGFRAGGIALAGGLVNPPPPAPAITSAPGYKTFGPETAWTYEIGTRMQFLDRRLRVNPTIFYTNWKNIQFNTFVFNPNPNVITENAGDARIWGLELETEAAVTEQFVLTGSYSYLHGEYTRIAPGIDLDLNSPLQHTPKNKLSVGARYTIPMPGTARLVNNLDFSYTLEQRSAVASSDFIVQPSYGLLNGRVEYFFPKDRLSIALYGTNLLNKYYFIGGVDGFATFGALEGDLGRPREYGLNARYRF